MRHIGSRHFLPVAKIRSRVGLRPKLLGCFLIVAAVACGALALYSHAPAVHPANVPAPALALVVGLALALGLTGLVVREVVEPIQALEARSEEMARGELARPVPPSGEADEIGRLTVAFEEMRRSLRDSTAIDRVDQHRSRARGAAADRGPRAAQRRAARRPREAAPGPGQPHPQREAGLDGPAGLGIAHEINNPVNAVINSLGPSRRSCARWPHQGRRRRRARPIGRGDADGGPAGAARTKAIVQALHNYSRGDDAVQREVNLARSVDDSLDLLRHRLRNVQVKKEVDPAARILGCRADRSGADEPHHQRRPGLGDQGGTIRVTGTVRAGRCW
jgi:HAMP domain-containing protein